MPARASLRDVDRSAPSAFGDHRYRVRGRLWRCFSFQSHVPPALRRDAIRRTRRVGHAGAEVSPHSCIRATPLNHGHLISIANRFLVTLSLIARFPLDRETLTAAPS